jgi:hypothetical protein
MCSHPNFDLLARIDEMAAATIRIRKEKSAIDSERLRESNKQAAREQLLRIQLSLPRKPR